MFRFGSLLTRWLAGFALAAACLLGFGAAPDASAAALGTGAGSAVNFAQAHGYRSAIAVLDTETGAFAGAGDVNAVFASESVVKVFIATRMLVAGQMHGTDAGIAYKMITQSDDASADGLYGLVGGDGLVNWINSYFHLRVGSPPSRPGWWGNTHITAEGMVRFYAAVKKDRSVWPWLYNAMSHASRYGSDGTYQYFGIPSATRGWAVKQGWGIDDDCFCHPTFNSTGFVDDGRYAVAILTAGPAGSYGAAISNMVTDEARILLDGASYTGLPGRPVKWVSNTSGVLRAGTAQDRGFVLYASDRAYHLVFQPDGNLVVYYGGRALWASGSNGSGADLMDFQGNGNLVLYRGTSGVWSTASSNRGARWLVMQDDGNLVMYTAAGRPVWSSGTNGRR